MKDHQLTYSTQDDIARADVRNHADDSDCWCGPELALPCVICLCAKNGCGACVGGWTIVDRETFDASEMPGVCVHRAVGAKK